MEPIRENIRRIGELDAGEPDEAAARANTSSRTGRDQWAERDSFFGGGQGVRPIVPASG